MSPRSRLVLASAAGMIALALAGCTAAAAPESASGSAAPGTRSVEHARGTADVPDQPERVVTLEPLELDTAVAIGTTPVGAAVAGNVTELPSYLGVSDVAPVGTVPEPDLEAIAALKPDLILGTESRHSELYEQLSAIAPTVFIASQADPWRENATLIGEALGREDEVAGLLTGVDDECARLKSEYALDGQTVQLIRPRDETTLSLYGPVSFAGSLLECVGFTIPDREWEDGLQADLSPENIASATADHVFVTAADVDDRSAIPAAVASAFPDATLVDTSTWVSGVGPKGAEAVLGDIERYLSANR
ncbi:iron-siderophore ABC transporter substrate-binding protein [Microbacterium sp. 77mftsu3.1]|uniref:iron-siderophore ABC transporter substrate-binding protein n=1 Tax=Microbacterium sp. 77mftsu3.1 TaxID=1761802 RepID=UPI0003A17E5E|nr:iron-siderophore ABC transporter substrate-binding protein [Microbacterium sp. 77mftsu3.1]SDG85455.1 iron complex transport system substrate-binding protein [Microbacterium sp. 77mftsu3.1]